MPSISDQLRQYATAVTDPTRGMILMEIDRAGEATATQIARRLGLTANNVYHHMRVLLQLGVVDPPRAVPGITYVEKFYRINPDVRAALRLDPDWYAEHYQSMSKEDRQAVIVSMCLTMSHLLRQAARDYQELDPARLDELMGDPDLFLLSIKRAGRDQLKERLAALRRLIKDFGEDDPEGREMLLFAGLPSVR